MTDFSDRHYLQTVTRLGDRHHIVSQRDIHSSSGLKLVAKGTRINSGLFERLVQHKLMPTLDHCLSMENAVDGKQLADKAQQLIQADPLLQQIMTTLPGDKQIDALLRRLALPAPIAFKLTVAREERPDIYTHSLILALLVYYIGVHAKLDESELTQAVTAAMLHDLGILHIDPSIFCAGHRMNELERRQLYAHPMIAYLLLQEFPEYQGQVSRAVLEHHERVDGSGYPQGLNDERLGTLGKLLALAEVAASRFDDAGRSQDMYRLGMVLRLNTHKLAPQLIALLAPLYRNAPPPALGKIRLQSGIYSIAASFLNWDKIQLEETAIAPTERPLWRFINEQINALYHALQHAGFNPDDIEMLMEGADEDPALLDEIKLLANEAYWQLKELVHEVRRRWPELQGQGPHWQWLDETRKLVGETSG